MTPEPWERMAEAEEAYITARRAMYAAGFEEQFLAALTNARGRGPALRALATAPLEKRMTLLPVLFELALETEHDIVAVREVIGTFDEGWLSLALQPLVQAFWDRPDLTEWEYRRLAELLSALNQQTLLAEVLERAACESDPEIRDIAEDFVI
jgi:hypothetical protein